MTDLRKAAEMAIEVLERTGTVGNYAKEQLVIQRLRQALAQPKQEPVAWQDPQYKTLIEPHKAHPDWIPLYTAPSKREWIDLTEDEAFACRGLDFFDTYKNINAKLKEKNA